MLQISDMDFWKQVQEKPQRDQSQDVAEYDENGD